MCLHFRNIGFLRSKEKHNCEMTVTNYMVCTSMVTPIGIARTLISMRPVKSGFTLSARHFLDMDKMKL